MGKLFQRLGRVTMMRATASPWEASSKFETGCLRGFYTVSVCIGKGSFLMYSPLSTHRVCLCRTHAAELHSAAKTLAKKSGGRVPACWPWAALPVSQEDWIVFVYVVRGLKHHFSYLSWSNTSIYTDNKNWLYLEIPWKYQKNKKAKQ